MHQGATTTAFTITTAAMPSDSTTYDFDYFVIQ